MRNYYITNNERPHIMALYREHNPSIVSSSIISLERGLQLCIRKEFLNEKFVH